jgi:hypothetical protein
MERKKSFIGTETEISQLTGGNADPTPLRDILLSKMTDFWLMKALNREIKYK